MITFIVDGFDPWKRVESVLRHLGELRIDDYEVILMASFLLDTDLEECETVGKKLVGSRFRLVKNDAVSIFASRLRAQELAHGEILFYLSPIVFPQTNAVDSLIRAAQTNGQAAFCSAPLAFSYPGGKTPRLLAHGFAAAKNGLLAPVLVSTKIDSPKASGTYHVSVTQPYCFCSVTPFYHKEDERQNFWQSHLAACERAPDGGLSIGGANAFMYPDCFPTWIRISATGNYQGCDTLSELASNDHLRVEVTAYGWPRAQAGEESCAFPTGQETEDDIFWNLLRWQMPQFIAAATQKKPALPLLELCRESLVFMASTTFTDASRNAEILPDTPSPCWQSYAEWLGKYEPVKEQLYARPDASFFKSITESKNISVCLKNLAHITACGLFGFHRKKNTC